MSEKEMKKKTKEKWWSSRVSREGSADGKARGRVTSLAV